MDAPTITRAPKWLSAVALPWFFADAEGLLLHLSQIGGVVQFNLINQPCLAIHHPVAVQMALSGEARKFNDAAKVGMDVLAQLIGRKGVLTLPRGDRHTQARKHLGRALHGESLQRANRIMHEEAMRIADMMEVSADSRRRFDMAELMGQYAIDVIARAVFGVELSQRKVDRTRNAVEEGLALIFPMMQMPVQVPLRWWPRFRSHVDALDAIVEEMIQMREQANDWKTGEDTLSLLLRMRHDGLIDLQEVRDNLKTLFIAGHETTASALAWLWYMLAEQPEWYDWMQADVDAQVLPMPATSRGGPESVEAVIKESMRHFPVAWVLGRVVTEQHLFLGERVEPGTLLFFSNLARHHDPAIWGDDAARVRPGRFLEDTTGTRSKLAYAPFGGGERLCLGLAFAMNEMKTLITVVRKRGLRFTRVPGAPVETLSAMTRKIERLDMYAVRDR